MDLHKRTNERDSLDGITGPPHRETAGKLRDHLLSTVGLDALVEVDDSFSKPYPNDPEGEDTCSNSCEPKIGWDLYFKDIPMANPPKPNQVHTCRTHGLSIWVKNQGLNKLSPHLARTANMTKRMQKSHDNTKPAAIKWGVATTGSNKGSGLFSSTVMSS